MMKDVSVAGRYARALQLLVTKQAAKAGILIHCFGRNLYQTRRWCARVKARHAAGPDLSRDLAPIQGRGAA